MDSENKRMGYLEIAKAHVELATSLDSMNRKLGRVYDSLPTDSDWDTEADQLKALVCEMGAVVNKSATLLQQLYLRVPIEKT